MTYLIGFIIEIVIYNNSWLNYIRHIYVNDQWISEIAIYWRLQALHSKLAFLLFINIYICQNIFMEI